MSEFAPPSTTNRQELLRHANTQPLDFVPLALELQDVASVAQPKDYLTEDDYKKFWRTGHRLGAIVERTKNLKTSEWDKTYTAESMNSDAYAVLVGVATTAQTCSLSIAAQYALQTSNERLLERFGSDTDEAALAILSLDAYVEVMIERSSIQLATLGLFLCRGNPVANRLLRAQHTPKGKFAHMGAPRILEAMQSSRMLHSIDADKRLAAQNVIQSYNSWEEMQRGYVPFTYGMRPQPKPPKIFVVEQAPPPDNKIEIERLSEQAAALRERHARLMHPFHIPGKLEKSDYRPFIRAVLHDVRLDDSSLVTPDGMDGTLFSKRLAATIFGIQKMGRAHAAEPERLRELLLSERTIFQRLVETDSQLEELIVETPDQVLSLDMMLEWMRNNWSAVANMLTQHWPHKAKQAIEETQTVLTCKNDLDNELNADPRKRLYALAKQLGRVALPPEAREQKSDRIKNYRLDSETAKSGIDELIHRTKDTLVRQRARVVEYFLAQATALSEQTGNQSYGLYFAEVANDVRDRYFIIKCRDDQQRDWFVLETLEGERATYVVPSEVAVQVLGPFKTPEEEIEAIIRNNKTDARALGDAGRYQAQIIHQPEWTPSSHIQKILQRMNSWQP